MVTYPKLREVFAANFRDRIIHHWIVLRLNPLFEKAFNEIGDVTYNCRIGHGTHKACEALYKNLKRISHNYQKEAWIFKGDLSSFFMSINKLLLKAKLVKFIKDNYFGDFKDLLIWVTKVIVMHHPEDNCILNSNPKLWKILNLKSLYLK